jgi:hypothetical protein
MTFNDQMTLGDARDQLRDLVADGATCPCCRQHAKVYRRKVNASMVRALAAIYKRGGTRRFVQVNELRSDGLQYPEHSKLAYWDLIEAETSRRDDGGRSGFWRVTAAGESFLHGHTRIAKYALIYNATKLRLDDSTTVSVTDVTGDAFDLRELMGEPVDVGDQAALPM